MSHPHSSDAIPTVILVPPHKPDKRATRRKTSLSDGQIPWMKIAIGGTIAFMAVVAVTGLYIALQGDRQPIDDGGMPKAPALKPVAQEAPAPAVVAVHRPFAAPKVDELLEEPAALPANKDEFVNCADIGTDVLFMKDPTEAFKRARTEKKIVFMVHLSGNLEDKEFT